MKKFKEYIFENDTSSVKEPEEMYVQSSSLEKYPVMSMKEALKTGIPLEESKRLIFERIKRDFH
ncbi:MULTISPECIES: hypothetical protein [Parabacteroides]|uniref:hypothetical protein n=1 Tax=Parabacteroides leei TaxID=2939491 RepID=UPI001899A216|nr:MULTISPECIES: hypothetical protein [Parabacteroides]MCL3849954.1 hypothetical protein [Parabacteroides leei]